MDDTQTKNPHDIISSGSCKDDTQIEKSRDDTQVENTKSDREESSIDPCGDNAPIEKFSGDPFAQALVAMLRR